MGDAALFGPQPVSGKPTQPEVSTDGAVIRIAHLGDCMGMLIRGEEIVWRTEEMWWNVSTCIPLASLFDPRTDSIGSVQHPGPTRADILNEAA